VGMGPLSVLFHRARPANAVSVQPVSGRQRARETGPERSPGRVVPCQRADQKKKFHVGDGSGRNVDLTAAGWFVVVVSEFQWVVGKDSDATGLESVRRLGRLIRWSSRGNRRHW
jgi:hypothetical protein